MTKTQRILTMMRFINNRQFFTLHTLCEAFSISRSTALRDLNEIQSLGLPLVSSVGPDGGYAVLHNQLLQRSKLTEDELRALIISFLQTASEQLPYIDNPRELLEKLFAEAMPDEQESLLHLQEVLLLDHSDLKNLRQIPMVHQVPKMLTRLFNICMTYRQVAVQYRGDSSIHYLPKCYVHYIFYEHGTWYVDLLDEKKRCNQVLPVTSLIEISVLPIKQQMPSADLALLLTETERKANVQLKLHGQAIANFQANHFFHDGLIMIDQKKQLARATSYLDLDYPHRVQAYANWILALGDGVTIESAPEELMACLTRTFKQLQKNYTNLFQQKKG